MAYLTMAQFDDSLELLAPALRSRAAALRALAFDNQLEVAEAVALAFDAAYLGDEAAASQMLDKAELLAAAASADRGQGPRPARSLTGECGLVSSGRRRSRTA